MRKIITRGARNSSIWRGNMRFLAVGLLGALGLLTVAPLAGANLVNNGSFETPIVSPTGFTNYPVGSGLLTGWTVFGPVGTEVSIVGGSFAQNGVTFPAQDGIQWLDLTGDGKNSTEGVSQTVATTSGHQYQLSFYIGNTTGGGIFGTTSTVDVLLNDSLAFKDMNTTTSPVTQNWEQFTQTFIASGSTTIIGFRNADPITDNNNGLDNVVLIDLGVPSAVPIPSAMLLLGSGLIGLIGFRRKFKK
jgi:hypothetical protein